MKYYIQYRHSHWNSGVWYYHHYEYDNDLNLINNIGRNLHCYNLVFARLIRKKFLEKHHLADVRIVLT